MSSARKDILDRKYEIEKWISEGQTKNYISKKLHCRYETLNSYLEKMNISYKGKPGFPYGLKQRLSAVEYSKKDCVSSSLLKKKLIQENIKKNKCEKCGISNWNNNPISLELHHIDDNHHNNDFSNLQILCPNCHSQTPNFRSGKNKKIYLCKICNTRITKQSKIGLCKTCCNRRSRVVDNRKTKIEWPDIKELLEKLKNSNYSKLSKELGVSDNAIRKHIKKYKL